MKTKTQQLISMHKAIDAMTLDELKTDLKTAKEQLASLNDMIHLLTLSIDSDRQLIRTLTKGIEQLHEEINEG